MSDATPSAGLAVTPENPSDPPHSSATLSSDAGTVPDDWRTESYAGLQVKVPETWGWGGAPFDPQGEPGQGLLDCGAAAFVVPGSREYENVPPGTPYVGRPIPLTDACAMFDPERPAEPSAPYVWLGAPIPLGTVTFDDGYVMETVRVGDSTVSVATRDEALRREILGTARAVDVDDNGCQTRLAGPPTVGSVLVEGMGKVSETAVCVYERTNDGPIMLVYSHVIDSGPGPVDEGATVRCDPEDEYPGGQEWVVLTKRGDDPQGAAPVTQDIVVHPYCGGIDTGGSSYFAMTPDFVEPWADGGVKAYVVGRGGPESLRKFFRGMLG